MPAHKHHVRAQPHGPDRPDDWRAQAACAGDPTPDRWFPVDSQRDLIVQLRKVCATCPVQAECLAEAPGEGFWGGLTESERAVTKRRKIAPGSQCGTYKGHKAHKRHGEPQCDPCKAARSEYDRNRRRVSA